MLLSEPMVMHPREEKKKRNRREEEEDAIDQPALMVLTAAQACSSMWRLQGSLGSAAQVYIVQILPPTPHDCPPLPLVVSHEPKRSSSSHREHYGQQHGLLLSVFPRCITSVDQAVSQGVNQELLVHLANFVTSPTLSPL